MASETHGLLSWSLDNRVVGIFLQHINMYNSDKCNWIAYVHRGWDRNLTGSTHSLSHTPENGRALLQLPQIEKWCIRKVFEWIKATSGNLCSPLISKVWRPLTYQPHPNSTIFFDWVGRTFTHTCVRQGSIIRYYYLLFYVSLCRDIYGVHGLSKHFGWKHFWCPVFFWKYFFLILMCENA